MYVCAQRSGEEIEEDKGEIIVLLIMVDWGDVLDAKKFM